MLATLKRVLNLVPAAPAPREISRAEMAQVQSLVVDFLQSRGIPDFRVSVRLSGTGKVLVMVEAMPCANLRHSNLMEFDIRHSAQRSLGVEVDMVFWRFMVGAQGEPEALREALDRTPAVSVVPGAAAAPDAELAPAADAPAPAHLEHYTLASTLADIEVAEISPEEIQRYLRAMSAPEYAAAA